MGRKLKPLIHFIVGTRPEALKLLPVMQSLTLPFSVHMTGQQDPKMLDASFHEFVSQRAFDTTVPKNGETRGASIGSLLAYVERLGFGPTDHVVVQGDTNSAAAGGCAAFHALATVHHVEAGLRTHDPKSPFPEEGNRRVLSAVAHWHYAPTRQSRRNLLGEGVPRKSIAVTGNTAIDALNATLLALGEESDSTLRPGYSPPRLLVTLHRREAHGNPRRSALREVVACQETLLKEWSVVVVAHPNPFVQQDLDWCKENMAGFHRVTIVEPTSHVDFVALMRGSTLIVSDSGGVQEEAPSVGLRVLVVRNDTERPEAIRDGGHFLVGAAGTGISNALQDIIYTQRFAFEGVNPFGDGMAGRRIADLLEKRVVGRAS